MGHNSQTEADLDMTVGVTEAVTLLNQGKADLSLKKFSQLVEKYPAIPEILYGCALASARLNNFDQAQSSLNRLLERIPTHPKGLALQQELAGKIKAPKVEQQSGAGAEMSIHTLMAAGKELLKDGKHEQALEAAIQAKKLRVPVLGLDVFRAECFIRAGRIPEAVEALKEELRFFPANSQAADRLKDLTDTIPAVTFDSQDYVFMDIREAIRPYTMLSDERLWSLYSLAKEICEKNLPGNFIECGVAAGGSSALLAAVIKRFSKRPRWLYSFDSFEGMPAATALDSHQGIGADETGWGTGTCAAPEQSVRDLCRKVGAEDVLHTVKGYFEQTLPAWRDRVGMIALLHLDGDWYESTRAILNNLYDRVVDDGAFQVDDYGYWDGCRKAIHEFADQRGLTFSITKIDDTGVFFQKPDRFPVNSRIPAALVGDFAQDDPIQHGIVSQMCENERFQIYYAIRAVLQPKGDQTRFVEVGSYSGASYLLSYISLRRVFNQVKGWAVEPMGQPQFFEVMRLLGQDTTHIEKFSHEASEILKNNHFADGNLPSFILIDGDHTYEGVKQDMLDYYPLLAPGGLIVFHDYLPELNDENREAIHFHHANTEPGIRRACHEIMEQHFGAELIDLPLLYPTNPTQTQAHLPIIPGVFSTIRVYRKRS